MDGVYAEQPDGSMLFHPLPAPSDEDIARLARAVCRKVTRYLGQLTQAELSGTSDLAEVDFADPPSPEW